MDAAQQLRIRNAVSPYLVDFKNDFHDPVQAKIRLPSVTLRATIHLDRSEDEIRRQLQTWRDAIKRLGHDLDPWN